MRSNIQLNGPEARSLIKEECCRAYDFVRTNTSLRLIQAGCDRNNTRNWTIRVGAGQDCPIVATLSRGILKKLPRDRTGCRSLSKTASTTYTSLEVELKGVACTT